MKAIPRLTAIDAMGCNERNWIQRPPTPEQLADDGRADGVPVVTVDEWLRRERQRMAQFSAMCRQAWLGSDMPGGDRGGGRYPRVFVRRDDGVRFNSLNSAASSVSGSPTPLAEAARANRPYRGYRWTLHPLERSA